MSSGESPGVQQVSQTVCHLVSVGRQREVLPASVCSCCKSLLLILNLCVVPPFLCVFEIRAA